jgi:hypothetical protein
MLLPPVQGSLSQEKFFIYAAADSVYFDLHARPLIKSVLANTPEYGVHIHIYDPRPDQIEFCNTQPGVSCTYEYLDDQEFDRVQDYWQTRTVYTNERQTQMGKKGRTFGPEELKRLIKQTYYACARFVRLAEILQPGQRCLSIDVDGLVRGTFVVELGNEDFYLYEKPKDGTHLAGAVLFNGQPQSAVFLQEYAAALKINIEQNELYWFLDQVILDQLVPKYRKGLLPMSYIDWAMKDGSPIWSAKGKRKELEIFKQEQRKYA